jgi:hypothetical protein
MTAVHGGRHGVLPLPRRDGDDRGPRGGRHGGLPLPRRDAGRDVGAPVGGAAIAAFHGGQARGTAPTPAGRR